MNKICSKNNEKNLNISYILIQEKNFTNGWNNYWAKEYYNSKKRKQKKTKTNFFFFTWINKKAIE